MFFNVDIVYAFPIAIGCFIFLTLCFFIFMLFINNRIKKLSSFIFKETNQIMSKMDENSVNLVSKLSIDKSVFDSIKSIHGHMVDLQDQLKMDRIKEEKVPVILHFGSSANSLTNFADPIIRIEFTDIKGNAVVVSKLIWDAFQYLLENPHFQVDKANLQKVMQEYRNWMSLPVE